MLRGMWLSLLVFAGLVAMLTSADGAHVRVVSKSTPEGTRVTVNGKDVQPGDWTDKQGHGNFEMGHGSSRVSYSSSSGHSSSSSSTFGSSSTHAKGMGKHCSSVSVSTTQHDGEDPTVKTTKSDKCDETVKEPSWVQEAERRARRDHGHAKRFDGAGFLPDELLEDFGHGSGVPGGARGRSKEEDSDWEKTVESDGKGIDKDFGHGMRGSAHGSGDNVKERVSGKSHRNADGSVTRSTSASATATSSSHSKQK